LAGSDTSKIIRMSELILGGDWKKGKTPKMWDGHTAERITNAIKTRMNIFD
jgi:hypothetical protein